MIENSRSNSPTLKEVAQRLSLSLCTVSRILNNKMGSAKYNPRTIERVRRTARSMGYRPHRVARSLRTQRSYEIGVVAWSQHELAMARIEGFERALRKTDYSVTVIFDAKAKSGDATSRIVEEILARRLAGVVLFARPLLNTSLFADRMTGAGMPYVVLGALEEAVDSVGVHRAQGVYDAVHYLARRGRERIAYLGTAHDETRLEGYHRALDELGRPPIYLTLADGRRRRKRGSARPVRADAARPEPGPGGDLFSSGRAAAKRFAEMPSRPDAVQAFSDELALGFLAGLHDVGLRVPDDVSLVGFDDRRAAALASPPLTTVAQPSREVGVAAAEILLGKIAGDRGPPAGWSRVLPTRLVVRESA